MIYLDEKKTSGVSGLRAFSSCCYCLTK